MRPIRKFATNTAFVAAFSIVAVLALLVSISMMTVEGPVILDHPVIAYRMFVERSLSSPQRATGARYPASFTAVEPDAMHAVAYNSRRPLKICFSKLTFQDQFFPFAVTLQSCGFSVTRSHSLGALKVLSNRARSTIVIRARIHPVEDADRRRIHGYTVIRRDSYVRCRARARSAILLAD